MKHIKSHKNILQAHLYNYIYWHGIKFIWLMSVVEITRIPRGTIIYRSKFVNNVLFFICIMLSEALSINQKQY